MNLFENELTKRVLDAMNYKPSNNNDYFVYKLKFVHSLLSNPVSSKTSFGTLPYARPYQPPPTNDDVWDYLVSKITNEIQERFPTLKVHSIRNAIDTSTLVIEFSVCGSYS